MDLLATLQNEWPTISKAPWSVGAIATTSLALGWCVGRFLGGERIRILLGRIDYRDDEIASLKAKLAEQPTSPDRKQLRLDLAACIKEGQRLQGECRVENSDIPESQIQIWADRVIGILNERLDESFTERFLSDAGLGSYSPASPHRLSNDQRRSWNWLHNRVIRLNEFLSELSRGG